MDAAALLERATQPESARDALEGLRSGFQSNPQLVVAVYEQLRSHPDPSIRQLAATVLRRRLIGRGAGKKKSSKSSIENTADVRNLLFEQLLADPDRKVRTAIAHLMGSIASRYFVEWQNELLPFLEKCATSPTEQCREGGLIVCAAVFESGISLTDSAFNRLGDCVEKGLAQEPANTVPVCLAAMQAMTALIGAIDSPSQTLRAQRLLQPLSGLLRAAVSSPNAGDLIERGLDIFTECARANELIPLEEVLSVARFMLEIAGNKDLEMSLRNEALGFIHYASKSHPKRIVPLVNDILSVIIPMLATPEPQDEPGYEGGDDDDELTAHQAASQSIDSLALHLPGKRFFPAVIQAIAPGMRSSDPWARKGALTALGTISEGCCELMKESLDEVLGQTLDALQDRHAVVRGAAALCLGQLAEWLQPDIATHHGRAIPVLLSVLRDGGNTSNTTQLLCYAVDSFCEGLQDVEIAAYVKDLLQTLMQVLVSTQNNKIRENCLGALGSVARAAGSVLFAPFANDVYRILLEAMSQNSPEFMTLKARAIVCAGVLISGLPRAVTAPLHDGAFPLVIASLRHAAASSSEAAASRSLETGAYEVREASFLFMTALVSTLKEDAAPMVPDLITLTFATLKSTEGVVAEVDTDRALSKGDAVTKGGSNDDSDDEDDLTRVTIRDGFLDEQEAAAGLLQALYRNVSALHMARYVRDTMELLTALVGHFSGGLREALPGLISSVLLNAHHSLLPAWSPRVDNDALAAAGEDTKAEYSAPECVVLLSSADHRGWEAGFPARSALHPNVLELWIKEAWPLMQILLLEEDSKDVVSAACSAMAELLEVMGPQLVRSQQHDILRELVEFSRKVFARELVFGDGEEEGNIEDDEDYRSSEESLFEGASCLVAAIAQVAGPQFGECFSSLSPALLTLARHKHLVAYRAIGIGCMADIMKAMGPAAFPTTNFIENIIALAMQGTEHKDQGFQRNSAYCLGVASEIAGARMGNAVSQVLTALGRLATVNLDECAARDAELCTKDNAVSAIGRILRSVPLDQPGAAVSVFMQGIPMRRDFAESENVIKTLLFLRNSPLYRPSLEPYKQKFLLALTKELLQTGAPSLQTKTQARAVLREAIQALGANSTIMQEVSQSDPHVRSLLASLA